LYYYISIRYFPKFLVAREDLLFDGVVKGVELTSLVSVTDVSMEIASSSSTFAKVSFCVLVVVLGVCGSPARLLRGVVGIAVGVAGGSLAVAI
jgi:hypothetical protein